MHPELEDFLESALNNVQPTSSQIGRVVVEPDYDVAPDTADSASLAQQLLACLSGQALRDGELASHDGLEVTLGDDCAVLKKYIRRITLHADSADGAWVEVAPPGNWI